MIKASLKKLERFEKQDFFKKKSQSQMAFSRLLPPTFLGQKWFHPIGITLKSTKKPQNDGRSSFRFWHGNHRNRHISDPLPPEYK